MVDLSKVKNEAQKANDRKNKQQLGGKPRYTVFKNKKGKIKDIKLGFGSWVGHRISEMVNDPEGINYIRYITNPESGFQEQFRKLVEKIFKKHYDDFLDDDVPF